jgi:hypothetical protein
MIVPEPCNYVVLPLITRDMDKAHTLAPTIERFYEGDRLKIIGDLEAKVYWYPRGRKTRPAIPIYSFKYDPQVPPPLGGLTPNFAKGRETLLDDGFRLELEGRIFSLQKLEHALNDSIGREKNNRIGDIIIHVFNGNRIEVFGFYCNYSLLCL